MNDLPVGRRVAQWRVRRNMTQQQFADRLGKSKSWVDKVERGVRRLERVSNLREVAATLRIDVEVLLAARPVRPAPVAAGVDGVRTALARYHLPGADRPPLVEELRARLEHAEQSYRHARYPACWPCCPASSTPPAKRTPPAPARRTRCWCRCTHSSRWCWSRSTRGSWPG
ncbi:helix-turn-helix domain-containing protein [Micromonospora zamorensis]|uniref:helix-turn-helix domain-containing protein n=1 Tax=Micromonospora zamorensis TaxID=709883 RepID=UPI0033B8FEF1